MSSTATGKTRRGRRRAQGRRAGHHRGPPPTRLTRQSRRNPAFPSIHISFACTLRRCRAAPRRGGWGGVIAACCSVFVSGREEAHVSILTQVVQNTKHKAHGAGKAHGNRTGQCHEVGRCQKLHAATSLTDRPRARRASHRFAVRMMSVECLLAVLARMPLRQRFKRIGLRQE